MEEGRYETILTTYLALKLWTVLYVTICDLLEMFLIPCTWENILRKMKFSAHQKYQA